MRVVNFRIAIILFIAILPLLILRYALHILFAIRHKDRSVILYEANIQADDWNVFKTIRCKKLKTTLRFLWALHYNPYYLACFYGRLGPTRAWLCSFFKEEHTGFIMSAPEAGYIHFHHPFSTIVSARHLGNNVIIRQNTTIGNKGAQGGNRPYIGNNVDIGANCVIFGDITIGDNVIIGAGSLVNKSIPNGSIVVGNPFRIIGQTSK